MLSNAVVMLSVGRGLRKFLIIHLARKYVGYTSVFCFIVLPIKWVSRPALHFRFGAFALSSPRYRYALWQPEAWVLDLDTRFFVGINVSTNEQHRKKGK